MRRLALALLISLPLYAEEAKNLLPNGDFAVGVGSNPAHWDPMDGLTTFWVKDPVRGGMCLRCDSDVLDSEFEARQEEMKKPNPPPAKPKSPTKPPKYDTVAGVEGVTCFSDFVDIKPRMRYRLSIDYRTDKEFEGKGLTPKVFVKAYDEFKEDIWKDNHVVKDFVERRVYWKENVDCKDSKAEWQTATLDFNPSKRNPKVKWLRVMTMAYWPPGTYYFTNVKITELGLDAEGPKQAKSDPKEDDDVKAGPADQDGPEVVPPKK